MGRDKVSQVKPDDPGGCWELDGLSREEMASKGLHKGFLIANGWSPWLLHEAELELWRGNHQEAVAGVQ